MEKNLEAVLGVRFLATEYSTGPKHGGRIDSPGLDEDGCPVIVEYKRATNQNVINQGLYYLDWLLDHQAEFKLLVMEKLGVELGDTLDWKGVRLVCVAGDYTKFDQHAVQQINRNIDLVSYIRYGDDLLLLELVNARQTVSEDGGGIGTSDTGKGKARAKAEAAARVENLRVGLREFLLSLGDNVVEKPLKLYTAYRSMKNFACVWQGKSELCVWVKVDPDTIDLEENFTRDVRKIGHWGTGDLEITLRSMSDLEKAKPLLIRSYEGK